MTEWSKFVPPGTTIVPVTVQSAGTWVVPVTAAASFTKSTQQKGEWSPQVHQQDSQFIKG